ncbi:MAG: hypothetical protein APF84_05935 [Gracilibacter sp. BRH_c7a]|nr:MAG: hypothetical protein APF84_05935 [Gracilibacter sp. BRH_c7a]
MPENCWGNTTLEEHHRLHNKIRNELPELLSRLAIEGQEEEAIRLLVEWGTFKKKRFEIYNEARVLLDMGRIEVDVEVLE